MKYLVQVSYTNPSHEHVSLRRRVDTVNRIVEAADEQQAILRVSRQQQALGFLVREAKIVVPPTTINEDVEEVEEENKKWTEMSHEEKWKDARAEKDPVKKNAKLGALVMGGGRRSAADPKRYTQKDGQWVREEVEQIDEAFDKSSPSHAKAQELVSNYGNRSAARAVYHGDGSATIHTTGDKKVSSATRVDHIHDQAGLGYNRPAAEYRDSSRSKGGLKFKTKETEGKSIYGSHEIHISHKGMKEEVESVDEANMRFDPEAAARPKSSDVKNFLNRDTNRRAGAASKKYIRRMTKLGGLGPNQTKKDTEAHMKAHFEEASKEAKDVMRSMRSSLKSMDLRHGVDSDKRVSGYKMSPAVKAAQVKSDALSKSVKRPQAGTLSALKKEEFEYIEEKLTAADPASKWISDFVASDNPKFEGKTKKERINMALGAYYAAKREKNEAVEKKYNEKEVKSDEKKQDKKKGSMNKLNMKPDIDINLQGVK